MLEGELVRLRALEEGDLKNVWKWVNDREVTQPMGGVWYPTTLELERDRFEHAARQGNGYRGVQLIIETKDGLAIGRISLKDLYPEHRLASMSIIIGEKPYWSRGYGTDAIRTLLRFAFEEMNLRKVELSTPEFNERALACYRKCGFAVEGRRRAHMYSGGRYHDSIIMGVLREEWDESQAGTEEVRNG